MKALLYNPDESKESWDDSVHQAGSIHRQNQQRRETRPLHEHFSTLQLYHPMSNLEFTAVNLHLEFPWFFYASSFILPLDNGYRTLVFSKLQSLILLEVQQRSLRRLRACASLCMVVAISYYQELFAFAFDGFLL